MRQLDAQIGVFLDELRTRGWYDEATIVFTSDHGEEFWEHGRFEHGHTLYDELLHVPLIVKLPRSLTQGATLPSRTAEPVVVESIAPTLLNLANLPFDETRFSAPALFTPEGALRSERSPAVLVSDGNSRYADRGAIIADGHKYIRWDAGGPRGGGGGFEELYDLVEDPGEQSSLAETRPELLAAMQARFDAELEAAAQKASALGIVNDTDQGLSEATQDELRALGYVK